MKKLDALEEIRRAELDTQRLRDDAQKEKDRTLVSAKREALEIVEHARREADIEYTRILEEAKRAVTLEREDVIAKGEKSASEYKERSKKNIDDAVAHIVRKVEEELKHV